MTEPATHPSTLQLDAGEAREHVANCERCAAYVREQEQWRSELPPLQVPDTRRAPVPDTRRRSTGGRPARWPLVASMTALAAAAAFVLAIRDDYVGVKGGPTVRAFVKHKDAVTAWDGRASLAPGDTVQLRVNGNGYRSVAVYGESRNGRVVLHEGSLEPGGEQALPVSFVVDAEPGEERLVVVFSRNGSETSRTLSFTKEVPR